MLLSRLGGWLLSLNERIPIRDQSGRNDNVPSEGSAEGCQKRIDDDWPMLIDDEGDAQQT